MHRVRLIHWNAAEAVERAARLASLGYRVDHGALDAAGLRALRQDPPGAIVIDLGRAPSQGRDLGLGLRKYKDTRHVPLVFVGGAPEKVAAIREFLPDAVYTTWDRIEAGLAGAIAHPPQDPVVPDSVFAPYAGKPLVQKLGIEAGSSVALVGAPEDFERALVDLPRGVELRRREWGRCDLTIWFTRSAEELEGGLEEMAVRAGDGPLWIAWPKKASGVKSDLSQPVVRRLGLAAGLVDYKICSVDRTWSALLFTQRK
jgi:hypothetical protein